MTERYYTQSDLYPERIAQVVQNLFEENFPSRLEILVTQYLSSTISKHQFTLVVDELAASMQTRIITEEKETRGMDDGWKEASKRD